MARFWKKRIKNTKQLAKDLGVEEEKIIELKEGNREIGGRTMDNVLEKLENNKVENKIKDFEIYKWYMETDIAKLRKSFGYDTQKDMAKVSGMDNTTVCNIEKKKLSRVTNRLREIYYFYQNDFNRNIEGNKIVDTGERKYTYRDCKEKDFKKAMEFFKEFDLGRYMYENNLYKNHLICKLGYNGAGGSQIRCINFLLKGEEPDTNRKMAIRLYKYLLQELKQNEKVEEKEVVKEEPILEDVVEDIEENDVEDIVEDIVEVDEVKNVEELQQEVDEEIVVPVEKMNNEFLECYRRELERINVENQRLKRQIFLYEKLIENIK
jgi:transcriptional regulator with XRE-family HTH domain